MLDAYNVKWTTQSNNASESMPCGGGDIGLNVWVEKGDVLFYMSRSGAFDENKVKTITQKVETSKDIFGAEKIQFMFSEKDEWELTYMLTDKGETIGTKKSFDRRDVAFQELVNKMIERNNNSENGSS